MIGRILIDGEAVAELGNDGVWVPAGVGDDALAASLNASHDPRRSDHLSDHHLPFGVAALGRAAHAIGGEAELARPIPPLPDGAVS